MTAVVTNAQELNKVAIKKMSDGVCECISSKEGVDTKSKAELEFGMCLMKVYSEDEAYYNENNMDFTDQKVVSNIGEQVGIQLAVSCPPAMEIFMMIAGAQNDTEVEEDNEEQEYIEFTGKIVKTDGKKFTTFEIKDEDGRRHNVVWLTYVDNDELLEDAVKGRDSYIFTSIELDIYDPRIGEYRNMLVLDRIDLIED